MNLVQSPNMASAYNSSGYNQPTNLSVGCNPLKTFQTPNMSAGQKVIRTNLSSYSQKKKDSVQAVLIQLHADYSSLRGSVTNYPNTIGSVERLPDYTRCIHMNIPSAGGRDLNHVNDVHSVDDLDFRCLRLISAFAEVTKNPAVLSPSSFNFSISSITSWGIRTVVICDFAFFEPVAITNTPCFWCISVYAKKVRLKGLKCISHDDSFKREGEIHLGRQNPVDAENTYGASNHNVKRGNTMAMYKSTQTHPKFKWRFFSCQQSRYFTVEARNEQEARSMLPDAPCLFSARIRQGVNHV